MWRTWVSPEGKIHRISDDQLYRFCVDNGLHLGNMLSHINNETSDQKNGGWRLIERLRAIGHVQRPLEHVLALGTIEDFYNECKSSTDW